MMRIEAVIAHFPKLDLVELHGWIEQCWVQPDPVSTDDWVFHEIDLARVRLIYELRHDLDTPEDTVPVVLALLDQVYELRRLLKTVSQASKHLPPDSRATIIAALQRDLG